MHLQDSPAVDSSAINFFFHHTNEPLKKHKYKWKKNVIKISAPAGGAQLLKICCLECIFVNLLLGDFSVWVCHCQWRSDVWKHWWKQKWNRRKWKGVDCKVFSCGDPAQSGWQQEEILQRVDHDAGRMGSWDSPPPWCRRGGGVVGGGGWWRMVWCTPPCLPHWCTGALLY